MQILGQSVGFWDDKAGVVPGRTKAQRIEGRRCSINGQSRIGREVATCLPLGREKFNRNGTCFDWTKGALWVEKLSICRGQDKGRWGKSLLINAVYTVKGKLFPSPGEKRKTFKTLPSGPFLWKCKNRQRTDLGRHVEITSTKSTVCWTNKQWLWLTLQTAY